MPDITFHIQRNDPAASLSEFQDFVVPVEGSLTVLEALFDIQEKQDPSLAFRYCCRSSICGSCAMYINGRYRLACQTNIRHLETDVVTVEPLPHVHVVRDLVWDSDDFFAKYEYIKPWLIHNSHTPETELLQSPHDRAYLTMPIDCILCACCYSSCPQVWGEEHYIGPAALLKAYRFEVDSRDDAVRERLPRFDNERGVYRCHLVTNCAEVCPKELNPAEAISWLKRAAVRRRVFGRRK